MKINKNFKLREIRGHYLLVPIKNNPISNDVIALNLTAGLIFKNCSYDNENDIITAILKYFDDTSSDDKKILLEYLQTVIRQGFIVRR